jgi:hypothetical protein
MLADTATLFVRRSGRAFDPDAGGAISRIAVANPQQLLSTHEELAGVCDCFSVLQHGGQDFVREICVPNDAKLEAASDQARLLGEARLDCRQMTLDALWAPGKVACRDPARVE